MDERTFTVKPGRFGQRSRAGFLSAISGAIAVGCGFGRGTFEPKPAKPCTDEQLAAWRARRAQGTPKKRPGHRCATKRRRRPSLR